MPKIIVSTRLTKSVRKEFTISEEDLETLKREKNLLSIIGVAEYSKLYNSTIDDKLEPESWDVRITDDEGRFIVGFGEKKTRD